MQAFICREKAEEIGLRCNINICIGDEHFLHFNVIRKHFILEA